MVVEHWPPKREKKPTRKNISLFISSICTQALTLNLQLTLWVFAAGYLLWNTKNSVLKGIGRYNSTLLTVEQTGEYYVYSRVTFSTAVARSPLANEVTLRKDNTHKEAKTVMQAYCNLGDGATMCTASQGELMTLERGNQLGVWVEDLSLVNYDKGATTFGMYKL